MTMRGPRLQVGSGPWISEERSCALQIAQSEVEEFSYSARNEMEWLNEHMACIFNENETNIADAFKTPGKLRGKTPRTGRKVNPNEARIPLSDVFSSATPNGITTPFTQRLIRAQTPKVEVHQSRISPSPTKSPSRKLNLPPALPKSTNKIENHSQDSGYYGSQDIIARDIHQAECFVPEPRPEADNIHSPSMNDTRAKHMSLAEEGDQAMDDAPEIEPKAATPTRSPSQGREEDADMSSPIQTSPAWKRTPMHHHSPTSNFEQDEPAAPDTPEADELQSPSDGSSPVRAVVRKSSLNLASLPAREPMTAVKNNGSRVSRISHLDHNKMSFYRPTGGKSIGNFGPPESGSLEDAKEMEDAAPDGVEEKINPNPALNQNKTYTQRLQDQILMLGKTSTEGRHSKSIPSLKPNATTAPPVFAAPKSPSPSRISPTKSTPGAFPDDSDDWIDPPAATPRLERVQSPRPGLVKSHTTDVMEGNHATTQSNEPVFGYPSLERMQQAVSPIRAQMSPGKFAAALGHAKSSSASAVLLSRQLETQTVPLTKAVTIASSTMPPPVDEMNTPQTPSKSPSRNFRESPLKQIKNKMSSIIKSSKGLLVSGAAISAEGKAAILSTSPSRLALHPGPSTDSIVPKPSFESQRSKLDAGATAGGRRTRASTEREKEEKRFEKETKRQEEQMDKLEKAREKEREKARVFSKEQERIAAMERQISAKHDEERIPVKETPRPVGAVQQKMVESEALDEEEDADMDEDEDMQDAASLMPPSSVSRSAGPGQATRGKEIKRPVRPTKETQIKPKQAPTVIRVNTGSQHSKYQPMTGGAPATEPESSETGNAQGQQQLASKSSKAALQTKTSSQSLKGASAAVRAKALELAAKKKEQEEREAQRRKEAKAEMERKRAMAQEEQRRQEQRRQEAERQKQKDREQAAAQAEAKQRQALIEKAKQTRAPPPAPRPQQGGHSDNSNMLSNSVSSNQSRPVSQMSTGVHATLSNASKAGMKRNWGPDGNDSQSQRPVSRAGPSYQSQEAKRRRTSAENDDFEAANPPNIKGPPVRPSAGFKKELPKKSVFQNGYTNAPPSATRDLFKATVTAQHNSVSKAARPIDMAQISKGAIPFAPSANAHKTPGRPPILHGPKSTIKKSAKSSPNFQNGEAIELPEIQTDDEDEDEDDGGHMVAAWADSPEIRRALKRQETIDPALIFGPPRAINMEEVFNKSKEGWHRFRARTSSANWSGADRLTEDDIRKDMAARDKLRREGGWSYDMGKELN